MIVMMAYVVLIDWTLGPALYKVRVDLNLCLLTSFTESNTVHGLGRHLITKRISIRDCINKWLVRHSNRNVGCIRREVGDVGDFGSGRHDA